MLPNVLTSVRILLTPVIVYALMHGQCRAALALCVAAGLTDAGDGFLARRFGATSRAGAALDPIADKLLLSALYVCFALMNLIPWWLLVLVAGRDALILTMAAAGLVLTNIRDFPPSIWGKISTATQILSAIMLLSVCAGLPGSGGAEKLVIPLVAAATTWSGIHYLWRAGRLWQAQVRAAGIR